MRAVKEKANAKINLYLDVISKRDDGFHDIKSVMHSVSLSDEITVTFTPSNVTSVKLVLKGGKFVPTDDKNIAVKAAYLYLDKAKATGDICIILDKKIPIAAGLAGGSSDAAATLRAMNKIFGKMFSFRALLKMAEELGSDVPYCLRGKTALCEGRGEIITPLSESLKLNVVIAIANEHIATPMAYADLDKMYSSFDGSVFGDSCKYYKELNEWISCGKSPESNLYNIFESVVLPICPGASRIKKRLLELGAKYALMCGSGPSVFGVFSTESDAIRARDILVSEKITAFSAKTV